MQGMVLFWLIIFGVSLAALVKGADWLITSAEKIGLAWGLSPFIVGVTIVAMGTSFPELVSSFAAVLRGVNEVVVANAVGSNIANILLVVGVSAVVGKRLTVTKNLIDVDLPLLLIGTVIFLVVLADGQVNLGESILMVVTYGVYVLYTILHQEEVEEAKTARTEEVEARRPKLRGKDLIMLFFGLTGLVLGAHFLIESLVELSALLQVATGVIAITAVAIGTSLPELLVSAKAAMKKKSELALGNIFGSNLFNSFMVVGLPGMVTQLQVDTETFNIGVPVMAVTTLLFVISGISKRIHMWEGAFFLSLYILFIAKLFAWF
jgi:cation:H+ antiporter